MDSYKKSASTICLLLLASTLIGQNAALAVLPGLPFMPKSAPFDLPGESREQKDAPTEVPAPADVPKEQPAQPAQPAPAPQPKTPAPAEPLPLPRSHERPWIDARPDLPL